MTAVPQAEHELPDTPEQIRHRIRMEFRLYLVAVAVLSLVVGGILGAFLFGRQPAEIAQVPGDELPPALLATADFPVVQQTETFMTVYVSGAVNAAQVVTLPCGSLVRDAVAAAGGPSAAADLDALNMAAQLKDHEHILVPTYVTLTTGESDRILLDINTATAAALETLPNIGPSRAQQIIAYREAHGRFERTQDIMNVSGIGPAIYEQLAPYITVAGDAAQSDD